MDRMHVLKTLIDEEAIDFFKANEEEYQIQLNEFLKINNMPVQIGIDLSNKPDRSYIPPT